MAVDLANGLTRQLPFAVTLWAIDQYVTDSTSVFTSTGVDLIDTWAYPDSGAPPIDVGAAQGARTARPDVAAVFGSQYLNSGFTVPIANLPSGTYTVVFFAHNSRTNSFSNAAVRLVTVRAAAPIRIVDTPLAGRSGCRSTSPDGPPISAGRPAVRAST